MRKILYFCVMSLLSTVANSDIDHSFEEYQKVENHYFAVLDELFPKESTVDGAFQFRYTQDMYRSQFERYFSINLFSMNVVLPVEKSIYDQVIEHYKLKAELLPSHQVKVISMSVELSSCKRLDDEYWKIYDLISGQITKIKIKNREVKKLNQDEMNFDFGDRHPPIYEVWYVDYPRPELYLKSAEVNGTIEKLEHKLYKTFSKCKEG